MKHMIVIDRELGSAVGQTLIASTYSDNNIIIYYEGKQQRNVALLPYDHQLSVLTVSTGIKNDILSRISTSICERGHQPANHPNGTLVSQVEVRSIEQNQGHRRNRSRKYDLPER